MKYILKYLPYLLIIAAFISGRFSAPDNSKEIVKKYEDERDVIFKAIQSKDVVIIGLKAQGDKVDKERKRDSLNFSVQLQANKRAYLSLKKKYNEINLNRASVHELDSIVTGLYP